jgi:hypothetical protein
VSVGSRPSASPPPPRLAHVRDLWLMHRPRKPDYLLIAAIFQSDTGRELHVGFTETNLIHSELSRTGDAPLLARAAALHQVLIEQGWIDLTATA